MKNENLLRKRSLVFNHPFVRLFKWIKTLLGEYWVKWVQYKNPMVAKEIQELYDFRLRHVTKMMAMFDACINEIDGMDDKRTAYIIKGYDKKWREHVTRVNTLNKNHQLLPDAFIIKILQKVNIDQIDPSPTKMQIIK